MLERAGVEPEGHREAADQLGPLADVAFRLTGVRLADEDEDSARGERQPEGERQHEAGDQPRRPCRVRPSARAGDPRLGREPEVGGVVSHASSPSASVCWPAGRAGTPPVHRPSRLACSAPVGSDLKLLGLWSSCGEENGALTTRTTEAGT
jgi:hypothetical protein